MSDDDPAPEPGEEPRNGSGQDGDSAGTEPPDPGEDNDASRLVVSLMLFSAIPLGMLTVLVVLWFFMPRGLRDFVLEGERGQVVLILGLALAGAAVKLLGRRTAAAGSLAMGAIIAALFALPWLVFLLIGSVFFWTAGPGR